MHELKTRFHSESIHWINRNKPTNIQIQTIGKRKILPFEFFYKKICPVVATNIIYSEQRTHQSSSTIAPWYSRESELLHRSKHAYSCMHTCTQDSMHTYMTYIWQKSGETTCEGLGRGRANRLRIGGWGWIRIEHRQNDYLYGNSQLGQSALCHYLSLVPHRITLNPLKPCTKISLSESYQNW